MSELRCVKCNAKLAEFVEGRVVIICRRCKTACVLKGKQEVEVVRAEDAMID